MLLQRDVLRPRKWFLGMRVYGLQWIAPGSIYKRFSGVLIRNQYNDIRGTGKDCSPGIVQARYTVACDDGKTRIFKIIKAA